MGSDVVKPSWRDPAGDDMGPRKREEMKREIFAVDPVGGIPHYNILLVGQIGSGKSSYSNAIKSVMDDRVTKEDAKTGQKGVSMTRKLEYHEAHPHLSVRICDTMGLENHEKQSLVDADIMNLIRAVRGNVPDGFEFTPGEEFTEAHPRFRRTPSVAKRAHCVAIVIDSSKLKIISPSMLKGLQNLRDALDNEEVPVYAILTHMDQFSTTVSNNVRNIHFSKKVHELVESVGQRLYGLPENQIFPVVNYEKKTELDNAMDILIMLPLRQMLYSASSYTKKISTRQGRCVIPIECVDGSY